MSKHVADMKKVSNSMSVGCHADNNAFVMYVMCCVQKIQAVYKFFPRTGNCTKVKTSLISTVPWSRFLVCCMLY